MKRILLIVLLILAGLVIIILFRTFTFSSSQIAADPVEGIKVPENAVIHMSEAIAIPTVSHQDPADMDSVAFYRFHEFLRETYPLTDSLLETTYINEFSVIYEWKGTDPSLKPVILMGHLDVVPVAEENLDKWTHPPFSGSIVDNTIWGRGALDDKVNVIGLMESTEYLLRNGHQPTRTILFCFGHDEEVGGFNGAVKIVEHLKSQNIQPEFVMDEGGELTEGLLDGVDKPIALIATGEKGILSLVLSVSMAGGHSSLPEKETSIDVLSRAIVRLKENPMPALISPPVNDLLNTIGPEMTFVNKMGLANRWLFEPMIISQFSDSPNLNALVRTTTAPTIIRAGIKENVIPYEANATVNFRLLPGNTSEDVIRHAREVINDDRVQIETGNFQSPAPPASSSDSEPYRLIAKTIKQVFPEYLITPNLVSGATDSRHFMDMTDNIYRFTAFRLDESNVKTFHGIDERIMVADFNNAIKFYTQFLENISDYKATE